MEKNCKNIDQVRSLDRDLYYEEGGASKVQGVADRLWKDISDAAHGNMSNIPLKMQWIAEKLRENYQSWKSLSTKERIPLIRQNLSSLLTELTKKSS